MGGVPLHVAETDDLGDLHLIVCHLATSFLLEFRRRLSHLRKSLIERILPSSARYFQLPFQIFPAPAAIEAFS